jgi:hypothetical protein
MKETTRRLLDKAEHAIRASQPFRVTARDLGNLRPGLSLDNVAELLERVEGPLHR